MIDLWIPMFFFSTHEILKKKEIFHFLLRSSDQESWLKLKFEFLESQIFFETEIKKFLKEMILVKSASI